MVIIWSSCSSCSRRPISSSLGLHVCKVTNVKISCWLPVGAFVYNVVKSNTCSKWLKMAKHWDRFLSSFFRRTWNSGGSRFQPIHLTMSYTERKRTTLSSAFLKMCAKITHRYLILFIQYDTKDLCTVSFLDAGPPSDCENIIILRLVGVNRQSLLCEERRGKLVSNIWY